MTEIPKIIHQIWIGPKTPPTKLMDTWKNKHEGFEYIKWTEEEMQKRGFVSKLQNRIHEMKEFAGKADILRWEILYKYGGIYIDADSFCLEPLTDLINKYKAFAGYENETVRGAGWAGSEYSDVLSQTHPLISNGTMAFPPKHELPRLAIEYIKKTTVDVNKCFKKAWRMTGPGLLTRLYFSKKWDDITILPSCSFLPIHCSGVTYTGHSKIYSHQEWGSTKNSYETMNNSTLPEQFNTPSKKVSILIANYNTKSTYIKQCLDSIKHQEGHILFEIVWIDDGSDDMHKTIAKKHLDNFINTTRFISLVYKENDKNYGLGYTLNKGVNLCTNEIIFRMDTDDIMMNHRIRVQLDFMNKNPNTAICGAQILLFRDNIKNIVGNTSHPTHTLLSFKKKHIHWLMNHPTFCFRKSKIIAVGNYNKKTRNMIDDYELELKLLKKYEILHNIQQPLLFYRLHPDQLTHNGGVGGPVKWHEIRNKLIQDIIY
jgi:mannosyltransferase OCH1-like enzyme